MKFIKSLNLTLAKASIWLMSGGIAGGVLGYLFQIVMGRMLTVEEYGLFTALMAMMMVVAAPMGTLTMVVSRKVSEYRAKQNCIAWIDLFFKARRSIMLSGILILAAIWFLVEPIQKLLKLDQPYYIYLLAILMVLSIPQSINNAYLQGLQYFKWLSVSGVLGVLFKIIGAALLVWFGFGVMGALGGVIIAAGIVLVITYLVLRPELNGKSDQRYRGRHLSIRSALPVFFANTAFVAMTQLDMVLVKNLFTEEEAGLYAAASILGKAVMYLPAGIAMALFPVVAENHSGGNSSAHLLIQSSGLTAILCGIGAIIYFFFGEQIVALFYGEAYTQAGWLLKYYGFAVLPMALVMIAEYYLIAMGQVLFAYLFVIVAPLQMAAIYLYHDELINIVMILGVSGTLLTIAGYGILWRTYKNGKRTT